MTPTFRWTVRRHRRRRVHLRIFVAGVTGVPGGESDLLRLVLRRPRQRNRSRVQLRRHRLGLGSRARLTSGTLSRRQPSRIIVRTPLPLVPVDGARRLSRALPTASSFSRRCSGITAFAACNSCKGVNAHVKVKPAALLAGLMGLALLLAGCFGGLVGRHARHTGKFRRQVLTSADRRRSRATTCWTTTWPPMSPEKFWSA